MTSTTIILLLIFLISMLGCGLTIYWLYRTNSQKQLKRRVNNLVDEKTDNDKQSSQVLSTDPTSQSSRFIGLRRKINTALAFFSTAAVRQKITSSYWPISDIEFVLIRFGITLLGLLAGWGISHSILGGIGLGFLFYRIPGIVLDRSIANRRKKFSNQLIDFLVLIKGAISTGNSLQQALDMGVKEFPPPICEEFGHVLRELKFGFPLDEVLHNLTVRMQGDDLQIVVTAIILNNQMGGKLSTMLEATIETIRDRVRLFGEVRSITSYSRFVSILITFTPFLTALLIYLVNPRYFDTVKTSSITQIVLIMAVVGVIIGNIVIGQLMKIRI